MGINISWFPEDKKKMAVTMCPSSLKKLGFEAEAELIERGLDFEPEHKPMVRKCGGEIR